MFTASGSERYKAMDMNVYQQLAARTIKKSLLRWEQIDHALHGMAAELGEVNGIYQKTYQGHELNEEHLKKEIGDLLWFIAEYCTGNCWLLGDIAQMNIDKLKARYPEGFDSERSLNRQANDI